MAYNAMDMRGEVITEAVQKIKTGMDGLTIVEKELLSVDLKELSVHLKTNCPLTKLNLRKNNIGDDGIKPLATCIKNPLFELDLSFNNIACAGIRHLSECMKRSTETLTVLELSSNCIGNDGTALLVECWQSGSSSLTRLGLKNCWIGESGIQALASIMKGFSKLQILDISYNPIGPRGVVHALTCLEQVKLNYIDLSYCDICDEGTKVLLESLPERFPFVKRLNLSANRISSKGMNIISECIKQKDWSVEILEIQNNNFKDDDVVHLTSALLSSVVLSELDVSGCNLGDIAAKTFADLLKRRTPLTSLRLGKNNIGDEGTLAIVGALYLNASLKVLVLDHNPISNEAAKSILELVDQNMFISQIGMEHTYAADSLVNKISKKLARTAKEREKQKRKASSATQSRTSLDVV